LKQTQNISPGVQANIHPNPITRTAEKVNFTAWLMSHTVAASLIALVATGKDHCAVCYELYSVVKEVSNEHNED
jgi:hypothetical protein